MVKMVLKRKNPTKKTKEFLLKEGTDDGRTFTGGRRRRDRRFSFCLKRIFEKGKKELKNTRFVREEGREREKERERKREKER